MIEIYDGNNVVRRRMESDQTGLVLRNLYNEVEFAHPQFPNIFVFDGYACNTQRRTIYPNYKANREPPAENIFASIEMFKELLLLSRTIRIEVPGFEADDVIATLTCRMVAEGIPVVIHSNDGDFQQLCVLPGVIQLREGYKNLEPKYVRLYKTLVGDTSDNIKGIPGFGKVAWENCDKDAFLQLFELYDEGRLISRTKAWLREEVEQFDIGPKAVNWICDHFEELVAMWKIVGFFDVPDALIDANTKEGQSNREVAYRVLADFFQ